MPPRIETVNFCMHVATSKAADVVKTLSELSGLSPLPSSGPAITDIPLKQRARGRRFAVSKESKGWVSVLDSKYSETESITVKLSGLLSSDIFLVESRGLRWKGQPSWKYRWFRAGEELDSYDSSTLSDFEPWDEGELDKLMKLFQENPAAAIEAAKLKDEEARKEEELSETSLTPQRTELFSKLLKSRNWKSRLAKILDDESGNLVPEPIVAEFLDILGINPGYAGINYGWLFLQDQDPEDLIPTGIRFAAHLG